MRFGNALPCGLMLVGRRNHDRRLLQIARRGARGCRRD